MLNLIQKGESRCFVFNEEDIEKVKEIIKQISEFEFDYLPDNWIAVWRGDEKDLVYNGKFDIDIPKLTEECGRVGIGIMIRSTNIDDSWY